MPVQPSYPGVYIEEVPSGVRTISGVSTSIALFIGRSAEGPMNQPKRCLNFGEFERTFSVDTSLGEMARSVRLFFDNGGTDCWVVRVAAGASSATSTLLAEDGTTQVLQLSAKSAGVVGRQIRTEVSYAGPQPEVTFNLTVYRLVPDSGGVLQRQDVERFTNLSMDANSRRFAPVVISQGSRLIDAKAPGATAVSDQGSLTSSGSGFSQSGRPLAAHPGGWSAAIATVAGIAGDTGSKFQMSVDGSGYFPIDVSGTDPGADYGELAGNLAARINPQLPAGKTITCTFEDISGTGGGALKGLRISSATGDVFIQRSPDANKDLAGRLMLGTDNGGLEVSRWAAVRPAPTGAVLKRSSLSAFSDLAQDALTRLQIDGTPAPEVSVSLVTTAATDKMWEDGLGAVGALHGNSDGVREKLARMAAAVNAYAASTPGFAWRAEVWGLRLALVSSTGSDTAAATVVSSPNTLLSSTTGISSNARRSALTGGSDGNTPQLATYTAAFEAVRKEVDLFNLLVIPKDSASNAIDRAVVWGPASVFCQQRRAFLIIDAPDSWTSYDTVNVNPLRAGAVKTHSAVFFPKVQMIDGELKVEVGPAGAVAGLMARTDATRGVWKAPAGADADIRSIVGLSQRLSNEENGVLNPRGVNTLRVFPGGIVNWGARTLDGDDDFGSEWKYIPVRRLALYIEESLYRGTNWVVFEPNDEPLWAQIRLNVGAFMHTLFRQGAFQGTTPREAYFVKCNRETTTQDDINRGVVNILVGFAPLKPAEFVIIKLQQIAGQLAA